MSSEVVVFIVHLERVDDDRWPFGFIPADTNAQRQLGKCDMLRLPDDAAHETAMSPSRWRAVEGPNDPPTFSSPGTVPRRNHSPSHRVNKTHVFDRINQRPCRPPRSTTMFPPDRLLAVEDATSKRLRAALRFPRPRYERRL